MPLTIPLLLTASTVIPDVSPFSVSVAAWEMTASPPIARVHPQVTASDTQSASALIQSTEESNSDDQDHTIAEEQILRPAETATETQPDPPGDPNVEPVSGETVVTARRRVEREQQVPIAMSVLSGAALDQQGAFTVQQVSALAPTLQYSSSNPRNTALTIRGLGVSYGLANDGLGQGVGFYVDGVYNSRPAAAAFDLLDIERVEVLRGPQGTLFGKNTTAGAVNISIRRPSYTTEAEGEFSAGDHGFIQGRAGLNLPIVTDRLAARLSFGYTQRHGLLRSTITGKRVNTNDNLAVRGQLRWSATDKLDIRLVGDFNRQNPRCCTQVFYTYGPTLKPAAQQFPEMAAALGYKVPSTDPYDRLADANAPIAAKSKTGGASLVADWEVGNHVLTSITAFRFWRWGPANDRDYTALDILRQSANPVRQHQWTQEIRLTSSGERRLAYTVGVFGYYQRLRGRNTTEWGKDASFWLLGSAVPRNLIDGYQTQSDALSKIHSYAAFGQLNWMIVKGLKLTPGLRYTHERKSADYRSWVGGGLEPVSATLAARKLSIARPQAYAVAFSNNAVTGDVNLAYEISRKAMVYGSWAHGYKSAGINLAGLPFNAQNNPALDQAVVRPEKNQTWELGFKSQWFDRKLTVNADVFLSNVHDFQANVVDTGPGALRGYLANVRRVRSKGFEWDASFNPVRGLTGYLRGAYTDAHYVSFANAPCPLERVSTVTQPCNLSHKRLPGSSKWAVSAGGEYRRSVGKIGDAFIGIDFSGRTRFYADASDSRYMRIKGYTLTNLRLGLFTKKGWEISGLIRNLFNKNYMTLLNAQSGNSGYISGVPGDQRMWQLTVRYRL